MRIIKKFEEASNWKKISKNELLDLLQKRLVRHRQKAEVGYNFEGYLFANGETKKWDTYIHFTPWYVSFNNGEFGSSLDVEKDIFIDSKNSNSDIIYIKGFHREENSRSTPSIVIFCNSQKIDRMLISPTRARDMPDGQFFAWDYYTVYGKDNTQLDFWGQSNYYYIFNSRSGEEARIYSNKKGKDFYCEINNSYDKVFNNMEEIAEYLNKNNMYYVGIDSN